MAQIYAALGDAKASTHYCYKALETDYGLVAPYYILAKLSTAQGDISAAKRTLKKIIYLDPNAVVAYLELSQLYQKEGNLKKSDRLRHLAMKVFKQHLPTPD